MTRVRIVTRVFDSPNTYAFLFPLFRYRDAIQAAGIDVRIDRSPWSDLVPQEDETLVLDGRTITASRVGKADPDEVLNRLDRLRASVRELIWVDTTASTGTLDTWAIPHVDRYWKGQLLAKRDRYADEMYGGRPFTHFYHEQFGIEDSDEMIQEPLDASQHSKLQVAWNSGLAYFGRWRVQLMKLHEWTGWHALARAPIHWTRPGVDRPVSISARFGAPYSRETVRVQRELLRASLPNSIPAERLSKRRYFQELRSSKAAFSPFGWGEKCYRDYESWIAGALLVKPDVSHLETWPDWYQEDAYLPLDWSLSQAYEVARSMDDLYPQLIHKAETGQRRYREYTIGRKAEQRFVQRMKELFA